MVDRTRDIVVARALLAKLLTATPYSPGDDWVTSLGLQGEVADRVKREISSAPPYQSGEHEIPTVKLYRVHLEKVVKAASGPRKFPAGYPSILDALATLSPGAKDLKTLYLAYDKAVSDHGQTVVAQARLIEALRLRNVALPPSVPTEPHELVLARQATNAADKTAGDAQVALFSAFDALAKASLADPVADRIARDGLAAFSVALRTTIEGRALVPVIEKQAARSIQYAQRDLFSNARGTEAERLGLGDVPARMKEAEARAARDETTLERANTALSTDLGVAREKTSGFLYRQSIVDQVVGVQWDSFRAHAKLDGEVVFFNQIGTKGVSGDYTGRARRLQYDVNPVAMVGGRFQVAFDWLHLQNAATLGGAFTTDRIFGVGGDITSSGSLGERLGLSGIASDPPALSPTAAPPIEGAQATSKLERTNESPTRTTACFDMVS